jgi:uncharacterized protein
MTTEKPMSIKIAVNLPVRDLADSTRFFAELGFPADTRLANENMQAFVISDDICVLLVDQSRFKAITGKAIPDTAAMSEAILQLQVESRQRVDELTDNAFAAGALPQTSRTTKASCTGEAFATPTDTTGTSSAPTPPPRTRRRDP